MSDSLTRSQNPAPPVPAEPRLAGIAPGSTPPQAQLSTGDDPSRTASFDGPEEPPRPLAPQLPSVVGGHEVLGVLGRGGMGIVFKARHPQLKRLVALKMVLTGELAGPEERERFRIEAEAAARLQHPNVVQIYEVGEDQGRPFLSLEYLDGGSLAKKLGGTPLPPKEAAALAQTLARAIHAAHQQGIVHRDLKPANVLLTREGQLKISDFGLAKQLDQDAGRTRTGQVMGTPSYMAPEQARGDIQAIGPAADIYALGVILYEMLTGRPPFRGASVMVTLDQVREAEPVPPRRLQPTVPRDLETICLKCLEKKPERRYRSAAELADRLALFLDGKPIPDRHYGWLERTLRWCRRYPIWTALIGTAFLTVAVTFGWWGRENALALALLTQQADQARQERYVSEREAARALARRGDWARAVELYDKAIPSAGAERLGLEVERTRALFPLGEWSRVRQAVERLAKRQNLGTHAATLLLLQADLALAEEGAAERMDKLLRAALAPGTLTPADRGYAQALLTDDLPRATALLEEALAHDPLHHRASVLLTLALLHGQRFEKAAEQLRYHRRFFAEDPTGLFFDAWTKTWMNQPQASAALLQELKTRFARQFTTEQFKEMEEYLQLHGQMVQALEQLQPFGKDFQQASLFGPAPDLSQLVSTTMKLTARFGQRPLLRHFGLVAPNLPWYSDKWNTCALAIQDYTRGHPGQGFERLNPLVEKQPDALVLYLRANLRVFHGKCLRDQGKGNGALMEQIEEAAKDADRAAQSPAAAPTFQRSALLLAVLLDSFIYHVANDPRPDWLVERLTRNHRRLLLEMQLKRAEHERLTGHIAAQFDELDPALVCPLLHDWHKLDPKNPQLVRHLARWELRAKHYATALHWAERRLAEAPAEKEMLQVRQQARQELQRLLERGK